MPRLNDTRRGGVLRDIRRLENVVKEVRMLTCGNSVEEKDEETGAREVRWEFESQAGKAW